MMLGVVRPAAPVGGPASPSGRLKIDVVQPFCWIAQGKQKMVCDARIERLVRLLESKNPVTRRNAAGSLRLNQERAIDALPALMHI